MFAVVVVFPTPPLPDVTTITLASIARQCSACDALAWAVGKLVVG
ncbi:hypothetical protein BOO71_0013891 [Deinococcus marmoris]|uniref:Uncharacterized protein n=1 Tax=Deinococcus marmoris TaxID=249408 RepID=A0A1U7NS72_9DEIO|nr:hypothetical protein BOO71_0013891 [Deinococcus marmoris]